MTRPRADALILVVALAGGYLALTPRSGAPEVVGSKPTVHPILPLQRNQHSPKRAEPSGASLEDSVRDSGNHSRISPEPFAQASQTPRPVLAERVRFELTRAFTPAVFKTAEATHGIRWTTLPTFHDHRYGHPPKAVIRHHSMPDSLPAILGPAHPRHVVGGAR